MGLYLSISPGCLPFHNRGLHGVSTVKAICRRQCSLALYADQVRPRPTWLLVLRKLGSFKPWVCWRNFSGKYSECLEEGRTCGDIHFLLLVDLWLFHFSLLRNSYRIEAVCSKWLLATQWCVVFFSLCLLSICLPSLFFCILFFFSAALSSWVSRRTQSQVEPCASQLFTHHYCILTLKLQRDGTSPLLLSVSWCLVLWKVPGTSQAFINTRWMVVVISVL